MREQIELEIRVRPVIKLSEWIAAARAVTGAYDYGLDSADELAWYINARYRGVPMDPDRSPRSNMMSFNVMQVRDLPCSTR